MADDKRKMPGSTPDSAPGATPGSPSGNARRRRPAPTIDLTATELGDAKPAAAEPPTPAPEPGETPTREFLAAAEDKPGAAKAATPRYLTRANLLSGLAGGVVVAIVLFAMWLTGIVPIRYAGVTAMRARVTGLEMQMHDLAARPPALDTKAVEAVSGRVDRLEQSLGKIPAADPQAAQRLAAFENALNAAGVALAALNRRVEEVAASVAAQGKAGGDADELRKRLDAVETAAKATQDKVAQNAGAAADLAARLTLAAYALRDAVGRGAPFAAQLAALRALGADEKLLAALEPFAAAGVPSEAALSRELAALLPALMDASGADAATSGNFIERLQANAGKLVRIRPAGAPAGDDASAAMARLELKSAAQDIAGAQAELAKLPAKARALTDAWSKKAEGRNAALSATDRLLAEAMRGLNQR
jgi:hypothetical protein